MRGGSLSIGGVTASYKAQLALAAAAHGESSAQKISGGEIYAPALWQAGIWLNSVAAIGWRSLGAQSSMAVWQLVSANQWRIGNGGENGGV